LALFGIVAACSILVGFVIPGVIAMHAGVFYYQPMVGLVEWKHPELIPQLEQFHTNQSRIEKAIVSIDEHVIADPNTLSPQATLRRPQYSPTYMTGSGQ